MALAHLAERIANQLFNLLHRVSASCCQGANLLSHHGEAFTVLTCAGGFYGGVQRQNIGLESDTLNHPGDGFDTFRCFANIIHRRDSIADGLPALMHCPGRFAHQLLGLLHIGRILLHAGRQLLHTGRGLFHAAGLLVDLFGDLAGIRRQGVGSQMDISRGFTHLQHDFLQPAANAVNGAYQLTHLILTGGWQSGAQIACGILFCQTNHIAQRACQPAADNKHEQHGEERRQNNASQQEAIAHAGHIGQQDGFIHFAHYRPVPARERRPGHNQGATIGALTFQGAGVIPQ